MDDVLGAVSFAFALFAFFWSNIVFFIQSENQNRIAYYWNKKGKCAWLTVFNTSGQFLACHEVFRPLSISSPVLSVKSITTFGVIDNVTVQDVDGCKSVSWDYMSPKSAIVIELESDKDKFEEPQLFGVINDGRIVKCQWWFDDMTHNAVLAYSTLLLLVMSILGFLSLLNSRVFFSRIVFTIYAFCAVLMIALGWWYFHEHRHIPINSYRKVRNFILKSERDSEREIKEVMKTDSTKDPIPEQ